MSWLGNWIRFAAADWFSLSLVAVPHLLPFAPYRWLLGYWCRGGRIMKRNPESDGMQWAQVHHRSLFTLAQTKCSDDGGNWKVPPLGIPYSVSNPESGRWSLAPGIRHNYRIIFIDAAHAQQFRAMWSGWLAGQERRLITVLTDFMHCTAIHH